MHPSLHSSFSQIAKYWREPRWASIGERTVSIPTEWNTPQIRKEQNVDSHNMQESQKYWAEGKKPFTKEVTVCDSIYMKILKLICDGQNSEYWLPLGEREWGLTWKTQEGTPWADGKTLSWWRFGQCSCVLLPKLRERTRKICAFRCMSVLP